MKAPPVIVDTNVLVAGLLTDITQRAIVLQPAPGPLAPDPGDHRPGDLLAARADLRLITGDQALLEDPGMAGRVLSARALVGD